MLTHEKHETQEDDGEQLKSGIIHTSPGQIDKHQLYYSLVLECAQTRVAKLEQAQRK
jgi:hypothetical protein